ncbi:MAG: hypothetical protein J0L76_05250 [Rhodobacterales bacterium]|nr:hypothetical protein [Rhodobacterales bacterium]
MKAIYRIALVLSAASPFPAMAAPGEVKTLAGCEVIDKGGYWNKVEADCQFGFADDGQEDRDLADTDGDPSTPPERVGL